MAQNPLYNTNDSPNNATAPSKAVNRQGVYVPRTHNTFDMSYFNFKTQRFGQYEPFFVMEGVAGDRLPFSSSHNVRSLPFASPFLSKLTLNKDYFLVPNQAIQPYTWEYIFKNPSQGDDVPQDSYNVFSLYSKYYNESIFEVMFKFLEERINNNEIDGDFVFTMLNLELFLSSGSLLYNLGFRYNFRFFNAADQRYVSFDTFFDSFFRNLKFSIDFTYEDRNIILSNEPNNANYVPTGVLLDIIRFFGSSVEVIVYEYSAPSIDFSDIYGQIPSSDDPSSSFNVDRLCAYQLSCAQYYVNPQVDFLYNAQLYRDNFLASVVNLDPEYEVGFFSMNGIRVLYDSFSTRTYDLISRYLIGNTTPDYGKLYDVYSLLFGYKETLKFGDYFNDSRTRPLAVGDMNLSVDSSVSVVDISRKIVLQRFLNNVVKLGNSFGDYLRGIYGTSPSPDYHFPKYIVHQEFDISGFETANTTSNDQGKLTSSLLSGDDTYVFEIDVDMPCIVLGISYFSVPTVYSQTKDRQFFHKDRFDFFNTMLQYTGDQAVLLAEKTDLKDPNADVVGYQSRYNEYKQRVSVASGGFIEKLPAWAFVLDDVFNNYRDLNISLVQSPVSIRHFPYHFDRFFSALSGLSLSNAFHFIVVYDNKCVCNRPMEINPNIL